MAEFLLHGLWLSDSGLNLWVEQSQGHRVIMPSKVPEGTFPPVVEQLLDDSLFRHRTRATLQTPKGKSVKLPLPTAAFAPQETIRVLSQLAYLEQEAPAATRAQREAIAPDLRWLIRMYVGLTRFIKAGRVTIHIAYQDHQWWPQWQLASGLEERGWLAEMVAAAPGVLKVNNQTLPEDMSTTLVHWITSVQLQGVTERPRPYPWHDFVDSLIRSAPLRRGAGALLRALNDWNKSITAVNLQLVFIVEQPPADEVSDAGPEGGVWPIRLQVRSGTDSPRPIRVGELDRASVEDLRGQQARAVEKTALVDNATHSSLAPYARTDPAREGDWDVYLNTDQIMQFVATDAAKLKRAGFTVMLPKAWSTQETTARLVTREATDVGDSATSSTIGMEQLVGYDWKLSVGDIELTEEEMHELVNSKSGLIRLRGQWVLADTSSLGKVTEYMEELAKSSQRRRRKELEQAVKDAEWARVNDADNYDRLAAHAEELRERFNADNADDMTGEVTLEELRQLALESLADEPVEFTGSGWYTSLLGGTGTVAPDRVDIPETVHATLREYQRRGVDWMYWMSHNQLGAVLADDMGLGKTLQLLSLLAVEHARGEAMGPTLVVAPTSVVGNWAKEAEKFVPSLGVVVQHGSDRLHGDKLIEAVKGADIVVTSYGVVGRDHKELAQIQWDHVVLDEAQAIKNSGTRASKSVRALPSRQRIALTGTPVENRLSEMRSILDFVNPGVLGSASFFRNHFAKSIERGEDKELAEKLRLLTAPFILRRLKTDTSIIDDLPDKLEEIVTVDMTAEQAALYTALTESVQRQLEETEGMSRRGLVLTTITRIKQICNHPAHYLGDGSPVTNRGRHRSGKVAKLIELLNTAIESEQRVLVFTQYRAFGDILQPYLSAHLGTQVPFLHGGVTKASRDAIVDNFQSSDGPPVMLLSLKAGGTGLNLTAASVVIHMDRWWNPAVENQATDRAFRIGQDKNVMVYKMITAGTLEESIQDILDGKTKLAGAVVGEGEGWITELNDDQLTSLMSYRGREK